MKEGLRLTLLGTFGAAAAFVLFGGLSKIGRSGASEPLDAMPKGSFIAISVDFLELRRSPVYSALFGKDGAGSNPMRGVLGVSALTDACGFDPMTRVQRFAVSVPEEESDRGDFGVAARAEVSREELETCARALADKRGGSGSSEAREVGSFVVLDAQGSGDGKSRTRPSLAYGKGGLLVVGKGSWFDAMLGAADGRAPALRDGSPHLALRSSLTSHEGFRRPTIVATAILPRSLRERLKSEMRPETGPFDAAQATMAGVLGVSTVGIAIHAGGPGENVDASVELGCDALDACAEVEKLVMKKRREWSGDLAMRMAGLGPALDSLELKRDGLRLRVTATANADALASTIERIMKFRARRGSADTDAAPPTHRQSSDPSETIPARPGALDGGRRDTPQPPPPQAP